MLVPRGHVSGSLDLSASDELAILHLLKSISDKQFATFGREYAGGALKLEPRDLTRLSFSPRDTDRMRQFLGFDGSAMRGRS